MPHLNKKYLWDDFLDELLVMNAMNKSPEDYIVLDSFDDMMKMIKEEDFDEVVDG